MFSPQLLERQTGPRPVTGESTIIPATPNFKHSGREGRKDLTSRNRMSAVVCHIVLLDAFLVVDNPAT